jgi:enoyl-CoA hydratase/carnithine racemase
MRAAYGAFAIEVGLDGAKSLPAIKARKQVSNAIEGLGWQDAYLAAQGASAALVGGADAREGVRAYLEHRHPKLADR